MEGPEEASVRVYRHGMLGSRTLDLRTLRTNLMTMTKVWSMAPLTRLSPLHTPPTRHSSLRRHRPSLRALILLQSCFQDQEQ